MKTAIFAFCLITMSLSTCKSKKYAFDALPERHLQFGRGGGFTGAVTTFTLLENGQIFKTTSLDKKTVPLNPLQKKEAKVFFEKARALLAVNDTINEPGNLYYFINWTEGEETKKIIWGKVDFEVPENVNQIHNELMAKIK